METGPYRPKRRPSCPLFTPKGNAIISFRATFGHLDATTTSFHTFMLLRGLGVGHSINDTHDHSSTADGESTHVAKTPAGVVAGSGVLLAVLQRRGRAHRASLSTQAPSQEPTAGPSLGMELVSTERRGPGSICARYATLDPRSVDPLHASMRVSLSCQVNAINRMKPPATLAFSVTL